MATKAQRSQPSFVLVQRGECYLSDTMILSICWQILWCLCHVFTFFNKKSRLTMQSIKTRSILRIEQLRHMTIKWLAIVTQKATRYEGTGVPKAQFSTPFLMFQGPRQGTELELIRKEFNFYCQNIWQRLKEMFTSQTQHGEGVLLIVRKSGRKAAWRPRFVKTEAIEVERKKKEAKMSKGQGLIRRKLVVAVEE